MTGVAPMDKASAPKTKLHVWIESVLRSLIASAFAVAVIGWSSPVAVRSALEQLRSFGPETIASLLGDARSGCKPNPPNSSLLAPIVRKCTTPLVEGWPAAGQWVPRLGLVNTGLLGTAVAAADVAAHLLVPTTVSDKATKTLVGFLGLLQFVLGFGITALLLRLVDKVLNDVWLVVGLVAGTLFIGSAVAWLLLPAIGFLLDAIISVETNSLVASVAGISVIYASGTTLLKYFLGKSLYRVADDAIDSVADKAAELFIRCVP
jgi:hypothetical protein